MINNNELLFVVDENNNPLEPQPRSFVHKNGLWHRTTGIWVCNGKGQILCQKRSRNKDIKPGFWEAFFGGHMAPKEKYLETAAQECSEELGIKIKKDMLIPYKLFKSNKPTHKEFHHVFALIIDKETTEFNFEKEEIDQIACFALPEIKKILADPKITDWVKKPWDQEVLEWIEKLHQN